MTIIPGSLTVVGFGPGDPALRTIGAQRALDEADAIIVRTRIHPGLDDLAGDPRVTDCDDLYQHATSFARLYPAVADRVVSRAGQGGRVVYAVPGHPRFAEATVPLVEALAIERGIPVTVLDAVSFVDAAASAAHIDPIEDALQLIDAERIAATLEADPFASGKLGIDPARPLLIAQMYDSRLAAAVKLALDRVYPLDHSVIVLRGASAPDHESTASIPLHALDRALLDHLCSLYVPPLSDLEALRSPETLARIVARLRAPGGCPWDRAQTHATMRNAIIEEAYETVDAIDQDDAEALAGELGDLLLLVMMLAQMAEEAGAFRIEDVYEAVSAKLIRRHPHVFGTVQADTPDAVISTWEGVKAAERAAKGETAANQPNRYERLPRAMPATRKVIELLAPRATLAPPGVPETGNELLAEMRKLLARGIDPEFALEASLRLHAERAFDGDEQRLPVEKESA